MRRAIRLRSALHLQRRSLGPRAPLTRGHSSIIAKEQAPRQLPLPHCTPPRRAARTSTGIRRVIRNEFAAADRSGAGLQQRVAPAGGRFEAGGPGSADPCTTS